jgi:hypothetical protein
VLDRENPIAVVAERLERLGITDGALLRYWGGWLSEQAPQPNHPKVVEWAKSCEPRPLVIVDSLVAFHGGDENDAGEMRAFMQQCRMLADLGATVAVLHHDGKGDNAKRFPRFQRFQGGRRCGIPRVELRNGRTTGPHPAPDF